jgi:nucleoid DNA-binding protein
MHKTDLVAAVATHTDLSKDKADLAVAALFEQITNALSRKETVTLIGFGSFTPSARAARVGKNPQTGARIDIAARTAVVFKPGKALKEILNAK